jgi:N-acetylmuramoyl-L-alanine amidase
MVAVTLVLSTEVTKRKTLRWISAFAYGIICLPAQVNVVMTRTSDTYPTLSERVALANSKNADYFCSIHINAGGGTGWESYIYDGSVSQKTINCRETIHNHVISVICPKYGVQNRGKKRANFYVLRETNMPAVLLENLFIDSVDLKLLTNSRFIQDLSNAIGEGIAKALDLPTKTLYKVIAGSYKEAANAKDVQEYLSPKASTPSFGPSTSMEPSIIGFKPVRSNRSNMPNNGWKN